MNNKELIRMLVNFDEEDTSTGFVSNSSEELSDFDIRVRDIKRKLLVCENTREVNPEWFDWMDSHWSERPPLYPGGVWTVGTTVEMDGLYNYLKQVQKKPVGNEKQYPNGYFIIASPMWFDKADILGSDNRNLYTQVRKGCKYNWFDFYNCKLVCDVWFDHVCNTYYDFGSVVYGTIGNQKYRVELRTGDMERVERYGE